jgi:photosystem II stability/assembly factor-like uncharacterized protein
MSHHIWISLALIWSVGSGCGPAALGADSGARDSSASEDAARIIIGDAFVPSRDAGPFVQPSCAVDPSAPFPSTAPALTPGVWTDIAPIPTFYSNAIVFDPCNPATLYTVGGNYAASGGPGDVHGVFRSTDAGAHWQQLVNLDSPGRFRLDPANPNRMYAVDGVNGGTWGFWRSFDGGEHWEQPQGFNDDVVAMAGHGDLYQVAADPTDFLHVLITFHNPWRDLRAAGVAESFDGGDSWVLHAPRPEWDGGYGHFVFFLYEPSLHLGNSRTWLFGNQSAAGYWRTEDAGETWAPVSDTGMTHGGAQIFYSPDGTLYLSGYDSLLRSRDNGRTFTRIGPDARYMIGVTGSATRLYTGAQGHMFTATYADDESWTDLGANIASDGFQMEMSFDAAHRVLYSANAQGGLYATAIP